MRITWACHFGNQDRLAKCLWNGLFWNVTPEDRIDFRHGYDGLGRAYRAIQDDARTDGSTDWVVYAHEDVSLHPEWRRQFTEHLAALDPLPAVVGVFGTSVVRVGPALQQTYVGHVRDSFAVRKHGSWWPTAVQALDGCVLAVPTRDTAVEWDPALTWDGYDVDICQQARQAGQAVMVIPVYTEHWCRHRDLETDANYQEARTYLLDKWPERPLVTTVGLWP